MSKQQQAQNALGETRLYRVTLVVAVQPFDYNDDDMNQSPEGVVLWASTGGFDDLEGVQIVGEPQLQELQVTLATPQALALSTNVPVLATTVQHTTPADEDSVVEALVAAAPKAKRRKRHRKQYTPRNPLVQTRALALLDTLDTVEQATAQELAALTGQSIKTVYYDMANLHSLKRVLATKSQGKVTYHSVKPQDNNTQTKEG